MLYQDFDFESFKDGIFLIKFTIRVIIKTDKNF